MFSLTLSTLKVEYLVMTPLKNAKLNMLNSDEISSQDTGS